MQLGAIRNLEGNTFDFLIGIIFNQDFTVSYAAQIRHKNIQKYAKYRTHTNAHIMQLRKTILDDKEVVDITNILQ